MVAINGEGDGPASSEATGTPAGGVSEQNVEPENSDPTNPVAARAPDAPDHLNVSPHDENALDLYWEAPASDGGSPITAYKVQWKEAADSWDTPEDVSEETVTETNHTINGLTEGVEYTVRVMATNQVGEGPASAGKTAVPRETRAPEVVMSRVDGATLTVLYDEVLREGSAPPADAFDVRVTCRCDDTTWRDEEARRAVDAVSVDDNTVVLTLTEAAAAGDYVVLSYTPSSDAAASRTRDLSGNAAAGFVPQEVVNDTAEAAEAVTAPPLTATLDSVPGSHDGSTEFTFELHFSEEFELSYLVLRDQAFTVTGSTVTKATRVDKGFNIKREIHVQPDGDGAVTIVLPVTTDCADDGAICTVDGRKLSTRLELNLSGPDGAPTTTDEPAPNTQATGQPTISGTVQVGETLMADTSEIADEDGLTNPGFTYQWARNDGATDTDIQGATASTYTLAAEDEGRTITVTVSFTDAEGHPETLTSDPTGEVAAKPNTSATGVPTIDGTIRVGETLTADVAGIADEDGLTNAVFSYQWMADDTDIQDATGSSYTLVSDDEGKAIKVTVSFTDAEGHPETLTSDPTGEVAAKPNTSATGQPTISGTIRVGQTLTAYITGIADEDGLANVSYSYQWIRNDGSIAGATGSTYTLVVADEGMTIKVRVSFKDNANNEESLTSAATAVVTRPPPRAPRFDAISIHDGMLRVSYANLDLIDINVPAADLGSYISSFKLQWKSGSQEYDATRQAVLAPEPVTSDRVNFAYMPPYEITGLTNGVEYTVRVIATNAGGDGPPSQERTVAPNPKPEQLRQYIEEVVEEYEDSHPWLRTIWDYLQNNNIPLYVWDDWYDAPRSYYFGDSLDLSALAKFVRLLNFDESTADAAEPVKKNAVLGKLAGTYTLRNGVSPNPGPLGIAYVYFERFFQQPVAPYAGCNPRDLYFDVVMALLHDSFSGADHWNWCMERSEDATALEVVRSALNGQTPAWFAETYHDLEGSPDLERFWEDVQRANNEIIAYQLRDSFGGYCDTDPHWWIRIDRSVRLFYEPLGMDILVNPWRDGGCVPSAPVSGTANLDGDGTASVSWEAPESNGGALLSGYRIEWWSTDAGDGATTSQKHVGYDDWSDEPRPSEVSETIDGLIDDVGYTVRVLAYNPNGDGPAVEMTVGGAVPTGLPTIDGTVQVGETLTANVTGIADEDGLTNVVFSYQWMADDTDIQDATGSSYTLVSDDEGKTITVTVSFTDAEGNPETLTSDPTGEVAAKPNTQATGQPTISGTVRVGETLTADTTGIADEDGLNQVVFSYQWARNDGNADEDIAGATGSSYTLVSDDEGKTITVTVSFTDAQGNPETLTSDPTGEVAAKPNSDATGAPAISGTVRVGETLTADTTGIADADGLSTVSYSYQWMADDTNIQGATDAAYTLTEDDEGKTIKVTVSFTDDEDNPETLPSAATDAVAADPGTLTGFALLDATDQTVVATLSEGDEVGLPNPTDGIYAIRADAEPGATIGSVKLELTGAKDASRTEDAAPYSLYGDGADGLHGEVLPAGAYTLRATAYSERDGDGDVLETDAISFTVNSPTTGEPAITGQPRVGKTLTANTSQIADKDGLTHATFSYQWVRNDGNVDTEIGEANGSTYTLTEDDEGKTIKVTVSLTDDGGTRESGTSAPTGRVKAEGDRQTLNGTTVYLTFDDGPHPVYTPQILDVLESYDAKAMFFVTGVNVELYPEIIARMAADGHGIGNHTWGHERLTDLTEEEFTETITRTQNAIGETASPCLRPPYGAITSVGQGLAESLGFQVVMWTLPNPAWDGTWVDSFVSHIVPNLRDGSIVLMHDGDGHGKAVLALNKILEQGTNKGYRFEPVCQPPELGEGEDHQNNTATGLPTITGATQVGETLTVDTSGIDDADGLTSPAFSYQWVRGDEATDTDIAGATGSSYTLAEDDEGKTIKVTVSFADDAGNPETLTSDPTGDVAAKPNTSATGQPTISGTARVGETLTADVTGVADEDGLNNVAFSYQWMADDTNIQGATGSSYILTEDDKGKAITVTVSFTDDADNQESLPSAPTDAVAAKPNIQATGLPIISGTAQVGQTLTADVTEIADEDGLGSATFSYQWVRSDGGADTNIQGATGSSYTLTEDDEGKAIKVLVSFTDDAGHEESLPSAPTDAVAAAPAQNNLATGQPTISGTAQVGETLTASTSGIVDADGLDNVTFSYQWTADDVNIQGATGSSYTLTDRDEGKTIKVIVSFTDDAHNEESLPSAATDAVTALPGKPQDLEGEASAQRIELAWKAPSGSVVVEYVVYRGTLQNGSMNGQALTKYATIDAAGKAMTYTDDNVEEGVEYRYRVAAVNSAGEGKKSNWLDITAG